MFSRKIVLASQSPRRKELLELAGWNFRILSKEVEETYPDELAIYEVPIFLAKKKAKAVANSIMDDEIILAADTIVEKDGTIYGKPEDRGDAIKILNELSGECHEVVTGVCLLAKDKEKSFHVSTRVYFNSLNEDMITHYVDQYQPFDKAGAYAIQEWIGLVGIEKIEGCYFNVVGLPVSRVYEELKGF